MGRRSILGAIRTSRKKALLVYMGVRMRDGQNEELILRVAAVKLRQDTAVSKPAVALV